jgi:hypothetical protein
MSDRRPPIIPSFHYSAKASLRAQYFIVKSLYVGGLVKRFWLDKIPDM